MGAHHVLDHREPLAPQIAALGLGAPAFVLSTTDSAAYLPDIEALMSRTGLASDS